MLAIFFHKMSLLTESYAFSMSRNARFTFFFLAIVFQRIVFRTKALSMPDWFFLNPLLYFSQYLVFLNYLGQAGIQ